jgi:multiple sugar transport system permease protein
MKSLHSNSVAKKCVILILSCLGLFWSLFPVYWMVKSSFTPDFEMYTLNPSLLPSSFTLTHYIKLFTETQFTTYLFNSFYVAIIATALALVISIFASYAMSRLRFKGRQFIKTSIFFSYLLPTAMLFIPMYIMISKIGLINNKNSLIIVYQTFIIPYCCYMLMSYFNQLPQSLEEAAFIDGCSFLQAITKVVIPIAMPGIAVVATFAFTMSWNEYLYAMVLTNSPSQQTVTIGISGFKYSDNYIWGLMMSSSVIASLPAVILYMFAQRFLVTGLASGSVKQ